MIPPQELRNKSFTRSGKGYDTAEVDEYLDFIIEKYSEIFAQCDKYDKKLRIVSSRISEIQQEEETIHRLVLTTQRNCDRLLAEAEEESKTKIQNARAAAEHILGDAREKAQTAMDLIEQKAAMQIESTQKKSDALLMSARARCTKLLSDFKREIAVQINNVTSIKELSEEFNSKLLFMYKNHLNILNENTNIPTMNLDGLSESKLFDSIMQEIKSDAIEIARKNSGTEYDFEKELGVLKESRAAVADLKTESDETGGAAAGGIKENFLYDDGDYDENGEDFDDYEDEDDGEDFDDDGGVKTPGDYGAEDDDVKVFAAAGTPGTASGPINREPARNGYKAGYEEDGEDGYNEKPQATYDSDDYEYGEDGGGEDENYSADSYSYANDDADAPVYEDNGYDVAEEETESETKGFFGFFKKKKKKEKNKYDIDGDGNDDDDSDIFEDLDEE